MKAILLHDAEDFVHAGELRLFDWMIERFDLVQIPVRPINAGDVLGISGHYLDEFAEAHSKQLVVREALGASIPSAGTGCAIARVMLGRIAAARGGHPFASDSLTEDYELGLRLRDHGGRGAFVRLPASRRGEIVAVQAYFPNQGSVAVRQKARWIEGIALAGWERLGWRGGPIETWMRMRDRRSPLAALVLLAAYLYFLVAGSNQALAFITGAPLLSGIAIPAWLARVNFALLIWRAAMRMMLVRHLYGWREGFWAGPRIIVSSVITIGAAGRAVRRHLFPAPSLTWDKTPHRVHPVRRPGASSL